MSTNNQLGELKVITAETESSFWQPLPGHGFASVRVSPNFIKMDQSCSFGTQMLYPGNYVREHNHPNNEEILHFIEGSGKAYLDGEEFILQPGVTVYIGKGRNHKLVNDSDAELRWVWFMTPNGLENFFEQAGMPRTVGEETPEPFERSATVKKIEENTVF
ncbi:cupin domain-containing protein [Leeia sp. TBRC 13508]|uniref:Cupin domain-containing protein n=1 Tax=Leeia speluncae TaxID=2884804 RepID=A0ABS8D8Y8_9NEIS|nr:cupin domain-containing protein [Leeia speluncae]MCB6184688.1 cupin domain-containing protein [Leeia speluncae]